MKYRVAIQRLAHRDLNGAYRWAAHHAPEAAARWLRRFQEALQTLADHPERCGHAPERRKTGRELRPFLFGRKPNVFRVLFIVDGEVVRVLRILRAQKRFLSRRDIEKAEQPDELEP